MVSDMGAANRGNAGHQGITHRLDPVKMGDIRTTKEKCNGKKPVQMELFPDDYEYQRTRTNRLVDPLQIPLLNVDLKWQFIRYLFMESI